MILYKLYMNKIVQLLFVFLIANKTYCNNIKGEVKLTIRNNSETPIYIVKVGGDDVLHNIYLKSKFDFLKCKKNLLCLIIPKQKEQFILYIKNKKSFIFSFDIHDYMNQSLLGNFEIARNHGLGEHEKFYRGLNSSGNPSKNPQGWGVAYFNKVVVLSAYFDNAQIDKYKVTLFITK